MDWTVRTASRRDIPELASALSRAFADEKATRWMLPDDSTRRQRLETMFATTLRWLYLPLGAIDTAVRDGVIGSGAAWCPPPASWKAPIWRQLLAAPGMYRALRDRLRAGQMLQQALEQHHPHEPHWYLAFLGTAPAVQGQGAAGAPLRTRLAQIDALGDAAYLETADEENLPIYERFGFRIMREIPIPNGAPTQWGMWRESARQERTR
jgi:ribosomal protein S18 acetylase RimI-like enzyme